MKVKLLREPWTGWHSSEIPRPVVITASFPFVRGQQARPRKGYIHRVRSAMMHYHLRERPHVSVHCWCGTSFNEPRWLEEPGNVGPVCGTCEGRAIGAGQPALALITRLPVKFAPRI